MWTSGVATEMDLGLAEHRQPVCKGCSTGRRDSCSRSRAVWGRETAQHTHRQRRVQAPCKALRRNAHKLTSVQQGSAAASSQHGQGRGPRLTPA